MPITYLDEEPKKKSKITYLEPEKEPERERTFLEHLLPAGLTKYEEKPGERTVLGELFERPGATARTAIRETPALGVWGPAAGLPALMGLVGPEAKEKTRQAALVPEEVPTFQESMLEKWTSKPYVIDPRTGKIAPYGLRGRTGDPVTAYEGFGEALAESTKGMALDIYTDPLLMLATMFGLSKGGQELVGKAAKTKGAQAVGRFLGKERQIRLPKAKVKVQAEVKALQKQFGLNPKKYPAKHVKTKIGELKKEKGIAIKGKVNKVKATAVQSIDSLKAEQKVFDDQLLKKSTDFAKHMKQEGPKWARQGSVKYGQMLDDIGDSVAQGQKLTKTNIVEFLDDTIITLEDRGQSGKVLNDLRTLRSHYLQEFPTKYEKLYTEAVNFGQFKKQMSGVYNQMSPQLKSGIGMTADDAAVGLCKQKWMDFLGGIMPEADRAAFAVLQNKYRQFAQAKKAMGQMFHPYSGKYDLSRGTNTALQFAEQRKAESVNNLMKTLETGIDDFIPGIKDIKVKTQVLLDIGAKKLAAKEAIALTGKAKAAEVARLNKIKTDYIDDMFKWEKKASDLSARVDMIAARKLELFKKWRNIFLTGTAVEAIRRKVFK